jgi:hypothetical protein
MGAIVVGLASFLAAGCGDSSGQGVSTAAVQSCMVCHNGSQSNDYSGPGLENPHPFGTAGNLLCTDCHGGNPKAADELASHVPPPPEIGDDAQLAVDRTAYFNRLTLTGIDKLPNYSVGGKTYTAIDYLQFINPGDLRVTEAGRACGQCHSSHSGSVANGLLATEAGLFSGASFAIGSENRVAASVGLYEDTAADLGFRARQDASFGFDVAVVGPVSRIIEYPVMSQHGVTGPGQLFNNADYDAALLAAHQNPDGSVITGTPLDDLFHEQVAFTCGDCHLGSAGANNRYGDFRSSGCTACHMRYSLSGRSTTGDPNVDTTEPLDPDDIDEPELPHPKRHLIQSVAKTLPGGEMVEGIDDYACAGCHQGSNRTVMQYWGIRLDQNQDVRFGFQYPAQPASWQSTTGDPRLFDPVVGNNTFNGRNRFQYLLEEDYDGDGRDDTPPDVHYEAGMGCIDCHGSYDLHGGDVSDDTIQSRMEHGVAIRCEDCHGDIDGYAPTVAGTLYDGTGADVGVDSEGNAMRHVFRDSSGDFWLRSRLTGDLHYLPQTKDTVHDNGKTNPLTTQPVYTAKASYAMGRNDGDPTTGTGPLQAGGITADFAHSNNVSCVSCHASWTNNCVGCHLEGEYNTNPNNHSNITGERIVFREKNALFTYQSPLYFQLGVGPRGRIEPIAANTDAFFTWFDKEGDESPTFAFSDRNGKGASTGVTPHPSLSHNSMMPHSIRGRVTTENEGPRYCNACHLTDDQLATYGTQYDTFRTALSTGTYAALDYDLLQDHIGRNPNNHLDSPIFVHMAAGLGTGLFFFDAAGRPVNPLDDNPNRAGFDGTQSPQDVFNLANVRYDLDRLVTESGAETSSSTHALLDTSGPSPLRDGATNPTMAGPLGETLLERLANPLTGIVLDAWLDANGDPQGGASGLLP